MSEIFNFYNFSFKKIYGDYYLNKESKKIVDEKIDLDDSYAFIKFLLEPLQKIN